MKPKTAYAESKTVSFPPLKEGLSPASTNGAIERRFDATFVAALAKQEKQIQQSYRPAIGVHKWFARRPGSLFRALALAEFSPNDSLRDAYYVGHDFQGLTALDPFMGGGTPLMESNRLGMNVVGCDINPMAFWIVRQELSPIDREAFLLEAQAIQRNLEPLVGDLYQTTCTFCSNKSALVKYFIWVKRQTCAACSTEFDLSPGPLVAENVRHPEFVLCCPHCGQLDEFRHLPNESATCGHCRRTFDLSGFAKRNKYSCPSCGHVGRYPAEMAELGPPRHRLQAIEFHCKTCKPTRKGRFFKAPDADDQRRVDLASSRLKRMRLEIPDDLIPAGEETKRLHKWGYHRFRELFADRQLLGLGLLVRQLRRVKDRTIRHALATVFSDSLRYQNMLCRYDTMALKCQDIFAVHGFPVGLVQCENNLLGIEGIGGGGFMHFVRKYDRAKAYCEHPFETLPGVAGRKRLVHVAGERIQGRLVRRTPNSRDRRVAWLTAGSVGDLALPRASVDAVFTDPPYYDNVQYAELMDFCYAWLRRLLVEDVPEFAQQTSRTDRDLTGNVQLGRDLAFFSRGLSEIFREAARALKPGGPFVFTYHHNDITAYAPVCLALLDANLICTAIVPAPAEMGASLHIHGTNSSTIDSVVIARDAAHADSRRLLQDGDLKHALAEDVCQLADAGIAVTRGDVKCLALGLLMARTNRMLMAKWDVRRSDEARLLTVQEHLGESASALRIDDVIDQVLASMPSPKKLVAQLSLFEASPAQAPKLVRRSQSGR